MLPSYLSMAKPNPPEKRTPWYKSTAPSYAGIFLWVVFYMNIADGTLSHAGLGLSLLGLIAAALICHYLFYLVPGKLGMQTGYPLYVVGSSTYGTAGGFLIPGLLMGLLQFGWLAVNIAVSTNFILQAAGQPSAIDADAKFHGSPTFIIVAVIWAVLAVFVALKGIQYLGKVSTFLPIVPLVMILIVFFTNVGSAGKYTPSTSGQPLVGFLTMIAMVVGFFATAGAAGVDFGMGNRNKKDIQLGGLVGIALAIIIAGGLPLVAIAGAHGANPEMKSFLFDAVISAQGGFLSKAMFILFAIASFAPACFSSFIAANSIGTMFPKASKTLMVTGGAVVAVFLAIKGWAFNLGSVFGLIGASFGPICGSMVADYLLSGRKWAGPRKGINWAGYIAWAVGFIVAILPNPMVGGAKYSYINPAPVIAFVIGFVLYALLAKAGLQPPTIQMTSGEDS
jgi:cytosine permease